MESLFNIKVIQNVIDTPDLIKKQHICLDGFAFAELTKKNVFDALIIRETSTAFCVHDSYSVGDRTIDECIELVNKFKLESVIIISNDISFLKQCHSVKNFVFYLNLENPTTPKLSYLSTVPGIKSFHINGYTGIDELYTECISTLCFQKLKTLRCLNICGTEDKGYRFQNLENFDLPELLKFDIVQCNIKTISGIEKCSKLQWLSLFGLRSLTDISVLECLAPTLRALSIDNCPKIIDFDVIEKLKNLEYIELCGKNDIPSLEFIKALPKLKFIKVSMNVLNGDISPCLNLQYADVICKKNYNFKNKDLPKDRTDLGFVIT